MRKLFLLTTGLFVSGTAMAEMPYPKKPYSAELEITAEGKVTPADMFISGSKIRMNLIADEGPGTSQTVVFVADRKTGEAFTLTEMDGQKTAIKTDFNNAMNKMNFLNQDLGPAIGTKRVGFRKCTNYKTAAGVTCLTKDNVVLESYDDDSHLVVTKLKMGKQDPKLFEIPAGYRVMALGSMMGGLGGLGGFGGGQAGGSVGGIDLGGLSKMGSPVDIGKALSEGQNANGEGFNSIMQNLGLPTENIDMAGEGAFANKLDGMIRDEAKGTNAEGIINGDLSASEEFRQGIAMRDEMTRALESGEDPLGALMSRNGVSAQEIADFRQQGKEIEGLNAPGGFIDQQIARGQSSNALGNAETELKKLEAINDEGARRLESGQLSEDDRQRLLNEAKKIEQDFFGALGGN